MELKLQFVEEQPKTQSSDLILLKDGDTWQGGKERTLMTNRQSLLTFLKRYKNLVSCSKIFFVLHICFKL